MNISTEYIQTNNIIFQKENIIKTIANDFKGNYLNLKRLLYDKFKISAYTDKDILENFSLDWSNIPGFCDILVKPKDIIECAIVMKVCYYAKIPITISAGKTNLTGSATPMGGLVLSTTLLTKPSIKIDLKKKEVFLLCSM